MPARPAAAGASRPLDWQTDALCAQTDPELFHPEQGGTTAYAKRICLACEVRIECLEYALAYGENQGVWGGMGPNQRLAIRRARDKRRTA
ncbi:WhiB family transcriptional regulator [Streptomyces lavendulocolor]